MLKLQNFTIKKQNTPVTCAYSTAAQVSTFLGRVTQEQEIRGSWFHRFFEKVPAREYPRLLQRLNPDFQIELRNLKKEEVIGVMKNQLQANQPLPIIYSVPNDYDQPNMAVHYSVVIGLNEEKQQVILADPFGYERVMEFEDFSQAHDFSNFPKKPLILQLALILGILKKNTIFIISKNALDEKTN